jgi:hypothetical protein
MEKKTNKKLLSYKSQVCVLNYIYIVNTIHSNNYYRLLHGIYR